VGAIVFGTTYGIGFLLIIIEGGVVSSPPVLSHSPSLAAITFDRSGDYQLAISCLLSFGLLTCSMLLWRARRRMIAYVQQSHALSTLKNVTNGGGGVKRNKIIPHSTSSANASGMTTPTAATATAVNAQAALISVGQRKFIALLDRLQLSTFVILLTVPLAASILLRDILWFSLVPRNAASEVIKRTSH
jgi:hypothetical protein